MKPKFTLRNPCYLVPKYNLGWTLAEPITPELVDEAEEVLRDVKKKGSFKRLNPVFKIADHFIRKLSKKLRAEPDQVGIYDKRYVKKLQGKVFGKGQSESGKTDVPADSTLPTLKEAQEEELLPP